MIAVGLAATLTGQVATPAAKPAAPSYSSTLAASFQPSRTQIYKRVGSQELRLDLFLPAGFKPSDRRPGLIGFHGGGWSGGDPRSMYPLAAWAAERGFVGVSVQYRRYKPKTDNTVFECVRDARSAVRYLRAHATEWGLDPERLVVTGSSAGGHLAVGTALFDDVNEKGEELSVSCGPDALILLWPVIDTSAEGYGRAKIGERWRELSPLHHVRSGVPPTLLFHGTADATVPFAGAQAFHDAMRKAGNACEFVIGPQGGHGFAMKDATAHADTLRRIEAFLGPRGYTFGAPKQEGSGASR